MKNRTSYHSTIKMSYALGIQDEWLPEEFRETIPRSTSFYWKQISPDKFVGHQYAMEIIDNVDQMKIFFDEKARFERQIFISIMRFKIVLFQIFDKEKLKSLFKENKEKIVQLIDSTKASFGNVKNACDFFEIKERTYRYWKDILRFPCSSSPLNICLKRVPNQTTPNELKVIRKFLTSKKYAHWPICSLWALAIRENKAFLSLATWYRYNKMFQFRKKPKKGKYKPKYEPLQAPYPNHTWHADITVVKTLDDVRHYVYLIVDNYSRYIINWKIADKVSGQIRLQTIKEAVQQEFGNQINKSVNLIVDGGPENNNLTVEQFIKQSHVDIDKKIALKDIKQSNSIVEASNKVLKHNYLYRSPSNDGEQLKENLFDAIYDQCLVRPHYALGIRTPYEAHKGINPIINDNRLKNAVKERVMENKSDNCENKC